MPYKHQTVSYRTIGGKRWECWGDFSEDEVPAEVLRLKKHGYRVHTHKMDDGMVRLFTNEKVTQ